MTTLGTHVLDIAHGCPAAGVALRLLAGGALVGEGATDANGRCAAIGGDLAPGGYRLEFAVGEYFRARGVVLAEPPFLDRIAIEFGLAAGDGHYHVPLLVSPYGYSTYRGS